MNTSIPYGVVILGLVLTAEPALAQWTPVREVGNKVVYSLYANADTIAAGTDVDVFVSTDGGGTWKQSAVVAPDATQIRTVLVHNGRLYAGTYGQGVFVSDDLGDSWAGFNQGLTGGSFNAQRLVADLLPHDGKLYAATFGAGVWIRSLDPPGTWSHYGNVFEPNQASTVAALAAGGTRLEAAAGANGMAFFRDPGQPDWTVTFLDNVGFVAGLMPQSIIWTGHVFLVGTQTGVFRSETGASPWTFANVGQGPLLTTPLALHGPIVIGLFLGQSGSMLEYSVDDGIVWKVLDIQPGVITLDLAVSGNNAYAGRADGLWHRSIEVLAAPGPTRADQLHFEIAGAKPVRDYIVFRFDLPEAGPAVIEIFDVAGRRVSRRLEWGGMAGPQEVSWSARDLSAGVYLARLTFGDRTAVTQLVHVR